MTNAYRDGNDVPTLIGVSSADGQTPTRVYVNPATHRVLVDSSGGGSGLTGATELSTTTPNGIQQTFAFTHTPTVIFWNGSFQFPTVDITISGNNVTFSGTNTPQTGDTVANLYA